MSRFLFAAAGALALALSGADLRAQQPAATDAKGPVQLSPFQVSTDQDVGYAAANSLSGSRLNSELKNTPAAISVFTKEFLDDIGVLNTMDALQFAMNASREFTDYTGLASAQQSDGNIQVRGFTGASLGRDFFTWRVSSDVFNTERLDFSRGPNSILFGVGGPGGIVNLTTKRAHVSGKSTDQVQVRVGSWDDYRATLDVNRAVGQRFAVRANVLWQDRESWREFEFLKTKGGALASTYRPFPHTEVRVQGEYADRQQLNAMPWPSADYTGEWIAAGRPIAANNTQAVAGTIANGNRFVVYDPLGGSGLVSWTGTRQTTRAPGAPSLTGNARALTDFSLVPRASYLGGPGTGSDNWYATYSAFVEQRIGSLVLELAFNRQRDWRRADFGVSWNNMGAFGDVNALIPTTALPNGSLPANAGQRNPNAGRLYVQSQAGYRDIENDTTTWRATGAYELNLEPRRLGLHRFAALATSETFDFFTEALNEVNITPPGTAIYPLDVTVAANQLWRRTYLDFASSDPRKRGGLDPREFPVQNLNGITAGYRRTGDTSNVQSTTTDSLMLAGQSSFWQDRVVATWGLRRDLQDFWNGANATRDPVTGEFSLKRAKQSNTDFAGNTRTYGLVVRPLPWLGLVYNNANNFVPQTPIDINDQPMGPRFGKGTDVGVKVALWSGRVNLSVSRYRLTETNRTANDASVTTSLVPAINEMWEALGRPEKAITSPRDSVDNTGRGWEVEVTANPTRQFRFTLNASQTDVVQSRTLPRAEAYLAANAALWQQNAAVRLVSPFTGIDTNVNPTIADAIRSANNWLAVIRRAEGRAPRQAVKYRFNTFGAYTLRKNGAWYDSLSVGGGANYRSAPVTGYDATRNFAEVYGGRVILLNGMLAKNWVTRLGTFRTQLNVDNLLDNDDLIITDKDNTGTWRYLFQTPRKWSVTVTRSF
ncbi:TonB-dependent siderophore receptor [Horticoccus sp. 23ND18S-11]|uniref:TonB-dependent siderophore receptor n=1 Tax=Horticoccus sp. 23ND18S-11 TaxID=3391832 RepID=UPI0039C9BF6E